MIRPIVITVTLFASVLAARAMGQGKTKTETFDQDPGWEGLNNRSAQTKPPTNVRQDFGFSRTNRAGGDVGEIGGFITPAAEMAYYATPIPSATFNDKLLASGTLACPDGEFHLLLGFFNADTVNEWRTPNSLALRLNGRGKNFLAYPEFLTRKWRIGTLDDNDPRSKGFGIRDERGREQLFEFPSGGKVHKWSLTYDPKGDNGKPILAATIGDRTAVSFPDPKYLADGAAFNRFGILTVMKSADTGGEIYIDDLDLNGKRQSFDADPNWEGLGNRRTYPSRNVRCHFDYGFSPTNFAGGKARGEIGGVMFRGDCRYPERMSCYGDKLGPLTLDKPIKASGKMVMKRGVTDSTTLFGFYNSVDSMRQNDSQRDSVPESVLGLHVEGPSSEGFLFYPVYRVKGAGNSLPPSREFPYIYPDGKSHDWTLSYDPDGAGGKGRITVSLDGESKSFDLKDGDKSRGTTFDRFGVVTSWIDGNSQDVYWDDITYTTSQ